VLSTIESTRLRLKTALTAAMSTISSVGLTGDS
jgi:hypothetical protein